MNPLTEAVITGTTGELLVQLRLFQYGVQAAPPIKDSGNDLIAARGTTLKAIQVKTTGNQDGTWRDLPTDRRYHVLALVRLHGHDNELLLDESEVYLIESDGVKDVDLSNLQLHAVSQETVDRLFPEAE